MEITRPRAIEIERNPKRCGGKPTVAGTRTTVHDVVANVRLYGGDVERMVADFPGLTVETVEAVLDWYREHQEEIDEILRRRREEYQRLLAERRGQSGGERRRERMDRSRFALRPPDQLPLGPAASFSSKP